MIISKQNKIFEKLKYDRSLLKKVFSRIRNKMENLERSKPVSILQKIRENKITARRTFELSPSNWRTSYAGISNMKTRSIQLQKTRILFWKPQYNVISKS